MNFINWFIFIFSWIFFSCGIFFIISCFVGILRFDDYFTKLHAIKISNIYGISSILFALAISSYDLLIFLKILIILTINILSTIVISHTVSRIALMNNIETDAISRRKYNELNEKEEKRQEDNNTVRAANEESEEEEFFDEEEEEEK